jgi:hypothetical protein
MTQGAEPQYIAKEFVILSVMAILLLAVSLKKFNVRLGK